MVFFKITLNKLETPPEVFTILSLNFYFKYLFRNIKKLSCCFTAFYVEDCLLVDCFNLLIFGLNLKFKL